MRRSSKSALFGNEISQAPSFMRCRQEVGEHTRKNHERGVSAKTEFDIAFLGHCTKDTIVLPHETKTVRGGAFYYGVHVVVEMGLKAAVITRLAEEDFDVVDDLSRMGVEVFAKATAQSTSLKLAYPT